MTVAVPSTFARMPSLARLLAAQIRYQARLLASGRAVTIGVGLPVILLVASHGRDSGPEVADSARYAVFGLTLTAWNTYGVRLVAAREAGILKRWRATPLPHWCYFAGRILATVVVAVAAAAATVAVGVFVYGGHVSAASAGVVLGVFALGALAWAATATAMTALIPTVESAAPVLMLTYFPLIVISGLFGSVSEPHWLSAASAYFPSRPLTRAATSALRHASGTQSVGARDLAVLAVWAAAGLVVAVAVFRWEPHRPARPGKQARGREPGGG